VASELGSLLAGDPLILAIAVLADLAIGDPVYRWHPIRLIGSTLTAIEGALRRLRLDGYGGGIILFLLLAAVWVGGVAAVVSGASRVAPALAWLLHAFLVYSLLALGDLVRHVWRVEQALVRDDVAGARVEIRNLVGRDTGTMDAAACRRAAIESLSENLTDGFTSPLFWYVAGGLPGLVLFKVVSTMDSMVGYKTPRYLRFGWCGARLDDAMNFVPARMTWLLIAAVAVVVPRSSPRKALLVGLRQHAVLPGPNSGWSEAATAGAIQRRLVGPIWIDQRLVTDAWLGDPADPPAASHDDVITALTLVVMTGISVAVLAAVALIVVTSSLP
jgi:adenosylcobinamide-phosphate synthase